MKKHDSFDSSKVTRVEVIDHNGRSYVNWSPTNELSVSIQDQGRTLKLFINDINHNQCQ